MSDVSVLSDSIKELNGYIDTVGHCQPPCGHMDEYTSPLQLCDLPWVEYATHLGHELQFGV